MLFQPLLLVLCLHGQPAAAQTTLPNLLPPNVDTFGFTADLPSVRRNWSQTTLSKMLEDKAMRPAIEGLKAQLGGLIEDLGGPLSELIGLFDGGFCFALSRESGAEKRPFAVLLAETKTSAGAERILRRIEERLQKAAKPIKREQVHDATMHLADSKFGELAFFADDKLFCISFNSVQAAHSVAGNVKSMRNAPAEMMSIVETAQFARHRAQLEQFVERKSGDFFVWTHSPLAWLRTLETLLPNRPLVQEFVHQAGWVGTGDVRSFGGDVRIHADGSELHTNQKIVLAPEKEQSGIFSLLSEQRVRERPRELLVEGGHMEISASWQPLLWTNMAELALRNMREELGLQPRSFVEKFEEIKAANPRLDFDQFARQFTGQVNGLIHSERQQNQPSESAVFAFDVQDEQIVSAFLGKLARANKGLPMSRLRREGFENGIWAIEGTKAAVFVAQHRLFFISQLAHVESLLYKIMRGPRIPVWPAPTTLPPLRARLINDQTMPLVAQGNMDVATVLKFDSVTTFLQVLELALTIKAPKLNSLQWPAVTEIERYLGNATFEMLHEPQSGVEAEELWLLAKIMPPAPEPRDGAKK